MQSGGNHRAVNSLTRIEETHEDRDSVSTGTPRASSSGNAVQSGSNGGATPDGKTEVPLVTPEAVAVSVRGVGQTDDGTHGQGEARQHKMPSIETNAEDQTRLQRHGTSTPRAADAYLPSFFAATVRPVAMSPRAKTTGGERDSSCVTNTLFDTFRDKEISVAGDTVTMSWLTNIFSPAIYEERFREHTDAQVNRPLCLFFWFVSVIYVIQSSTKIGDKGNQQDRYEIYFLVRVVSLVVPSLMLTIPLWPRFKWTWKAISVGFLVTFGCVSMSLKAYKQRYENDDVVSNLEATLSIVGGLLNHSFGHGAGATMGIFSTLLLNATGVDRRLTQITSPELGPDQTLRENILTSHDMISHDYEVIMNRIWPILMTIICAQIVKRFRPCVIVGIVCWVCWLCVLVSGPGGYRFEWQEIGFMLLAELLVIYGVYARDQQERINFLNVFSKHVQAKRVEKKLAQLRDRVSTRTGVGTVLGEIIRKLDQVSARMDNNGSDTEGGSLESDSLRQVKALLLANAGSGDLARPHVLDKSFSEATPEMRAWFGEAGVLRTSSRIGSGTSGLAGPLMVTTRHESTDASRASMLGMVSLDSTRSTLGASSDSIASPGVSSTYYLAGSKNGSIEELPPNSPLAKAVDSACNHDWNRDTLAIVEQGFDPVFVVGVAVGRMHTFLPRFDIDRGRWAKFCAAIGAGYIDNQYHNAAHGADVLNSVHYILDGLKLRKGCTTKSERLSSTQFFSSLVAAMIHDFRHPGMNTTHIVRSRHDIALRHHDESPLERMHVAEMFILVNAQPELDIFENMTADEYKECRAIIIELVLSTDLAKHFGFAEKLRIRVDSQASASSQHELVESSSAVGMKTASSSGIGPHTAHTLDATTLMKMAIKISDIGHVAKSLDLHLKWSARIQEEFYQQGDREKELGWDVAALFDREEEASIPSNQIGFMNIFVHPFHDSITALIPAMGELRSYVAGNRTYWEGKVKEGKQAAADTGAKSS